MDVQIKRYKGYLAQKFSSLNNPFNLIDVNKKIKKKKEEKRNFCLFWYLECNARKVICSCVYSVYILKPVLSGRNLWTRKDASVFFYYPRRLKALNFDNFDNSHNSFLWPEYFIDYICERWIPCQASTSVLCLHYRPVTVHCSTKDAYTSEITFLALNPCWYKHMAIKKYWSKFHVILKSYIFFIKGFLRITEMFWIF